MADVTTDIDDLNVNDVSDDDIDEVLDPNYIAGDEILVSDLTDVNSSTAQFSLELPEDSKADSPTVPVSITDEDTDTQDQEDTVNSELFRQPYDNEFVFGQDENQGVLGVYSSELGLIVGQVPLPTAPSITENTQNVSGMYGQRWLGNSYGAKEFDIPVTIMADDETDYKEKIEMISNALIALGNEEHSMTFGQYPDRTYYGHFTDLPAFSFVNVGMWDSSATLKFIASDPIGYMDEVTEPINATPYTFVPQGTATSHPVIHFEFLKDSMFVGVENAKGEQVSIGFDPDATMPDLKPVIFKEPFSDLSTLTQIVQTVQTSDDKTQLTKSASINDKQYGLANALPDDNATAEITDSGNGVTYGKFYKSAGHDYNSKSSKAYGLALETGTFSTLTPSSDHAWQLDTRIRHSKIYGRARQRVEMYLIDENGKRVGRFGIEDAPDGASPNVYMLFGSSIAKENAWLSKGYGYNGHGNTSYAKSRSKNGNNKNTDIKYKKSVDDDKIYKFSQSISRTIKTITYNRELSKTQADKEKKIVYGTKTTTTRSESAEIAFMYDSKGKVDKSSNGNPYLYDAKTGSRLKWAVKPKGGSKDKGDYVTTADFDRIHSTENDDDKINDIIEATTLSWTLKSNHAEHDTVVLNKISKTTKTVKKKKKTTITSKPINYTAKRSIKYVHKVYDANSKGGILTTTTRISRYEANNATGKGWKLTAKPDVTKSVDNKSTRSTVSKTSIQEKSVQETQANYNNTTALSKGFFLFTVKSIGSKFSITVSTIDTTGKQIPNSVILKKTWTMPTALRNIALNQVTAFYGKTLIMEDKLDTNKKVAKAYTDDTLAITDLKVRKLLTDDEVNTPHVIVHKGDTLDIDSVTEDIRINGKQVNNLLTDLIDFPSFDGGKQETLQFTPDLNGATITMVYRPTMK